MARHYDRVVSVLIGLTVKNGFVAKCSAFAAESHKVVSAESPNTTTIEESHKVPDESQLVPLGTWVTADAPARIDLAGGWTDTPPICTDLGGKVCGIAVTVDGKVGQKKTTHNLLRSKV